MSEYEFKFTTPEICLQAISRFIYLSVGDSAEYIFDRIPKKFLTQDFFVMLLDAAPDALQYIPKTQELCLLAITKDGHALKYVPDEYKTEELCTAAVNQCTNALEYVPDHLKTPELCLLAITNYGYALQYVPDELKIRDICYTTVKNSGLSSASLRSNGQTLKYVPKHLKTIDICAAAVQKSNRALGFVPPEIVEQVLEAVRNTEDEK